MSKITFKIKQELLDLLLQIPNPETVAIAPDLSNPKYKYHLREDGTIKAKERAYLSNGNRGN